jgi:hypothetical protein
MHNLDPKILEAWLGDFEGKRIIYPDVASAIVDWIIKGLNTNQWASSQALSDCLWQRVELSDIKEFV